MSKKAFFILITLIAIFIALAMHNAKKQSLRVDNEKTILLEFEIEKIQSIKISSKENANLSFLKKESAWLCPTKFNYPANKKKINELLITLNQLESSQRITSNPKNFSQLGVDIKDTTLIELKDSNDKIISAINIGKNRDSSNAKYYEAAGQYVLPHSKNAVYIIASPIQISNDITDWLNNSIFSINKSQIENISFFITEFPFKLINSDKENNTFKLEVVKDGDKEKNWEINQIVELFENFSFSDIESISNKENDIQNFKLLLTIQTFEGIKYNISLFEEKDKSYIKINCLSDKDDMKTKIEQLNANFSNWIYELETWDLSALKKSYNDLIEPINAKPDEASNSLEKEYSQDEEINDQSNEDIEENAVLPSPLQPELG